MSFLWNKESTQVSNYSYRLQSDGTVEVLRYFGEEEHIVVPSKICGKNVTRIGERAFSACTNAKTITLPESVTQIGNCVFWLDKNVENIIVPDSITSFADRIDNYIFYYPVFLTVYNKSRKKKYPVKIQSLREFRSLVLLFREGDFQLFAESKISMHLKFNIALDWAEEGNGFYDYCRRFITRVFPVLLDGKDFETITLAEKKGFIVNERTVKNLIRKYSDSETQNTEILAFLLEYQKNHYSDKKKREVDEFSLDSALTKEDYLDMGFDIKTKTGELVKYKGKDASVVIPSCVKKIGDGAFRETEIVEVSIPQGVTAIDSSAFAYCKGLRNIKIPAS